MSARGVTGWRADRLRSARTQAGLTQAELAYRAGVAPWTVWAWENTARSPTVTHLTALARTLEVRRDWLAPTPRAANLRDLRQRAGLTQRQAARQLGRDPGTVARVEHGRWWPTNARQWAALYQVSLDVFRRAWHRSPAP